MEGVDYILSDGRMWHLDMRKMIEAGIDVNRMAQMFASGKASGEIISLLGGKLQQVSDFSMPMPISSSNPIKVFLRNQLTGNPIIAGSSLKGAIRSILFTFLRERGETRNNEVFGNLNDGSDFMRFIRVGDIEFPHKSTELVNTKIFNLGGGQGHWIGGWKHKGGFASETTTQFNETGFNTIYECLPVGRESNGYIMMSDIAFENARKVIKVADNPKKSEIINSNIDMLCRIINAHTKKYLDKELQFFKKFQQAENAYYLYEDENDFSGGIVILQGEFTDLKPNECILKMSAGAGFHSITGDWQFDNYYSGTLDQKHNKGAKPKSRKIAITHEEDDMFLDLMGFVKLSFEEVEA